MPEKGNKRIKDARELLGPALASLQDDSDHPADVEAVTNGIAEAVRALFEAEKSASEIEMMRALRTAIGSLGQTLVLLQDTRSDHPAIAITTEKIAKAMSTLHPLIPRISSIPPPPRRSAGKISAPEPTIPVENVAVEIGANTSSNFYVGFSGDINDGGVFVATYNVVKVDTPIALQLSLPGGFNAILKGRVSFVCDPHDGTSETEPGIGVRFENLAKEHRDLILRFIRKRAPMFYDE